MPLVKPITFRQKRLIARMAWERGVPVKTYPETAAQASQLIQHLMGLPAQPIVESQVRQIAALNEAIASFLADWVPAELPADRAAANALIRDLERRVNRTQAASTDVSEFLGEVGETAPEPNRAELAAATATEDVPF
jgi:hypothetical protein